MGVPFTVSSVPAQTPYVQYVSGSGQTVFPYPFEITQDSDLVCLINGVAQPTDGGYTLSGQGTTNGGNLTFAIGQTIGTIITLYRNISIARITQLSQNGTFFASNFNNEFNRIYLIMQQLQQSLLPGGNQAYALMIPNSNNPPPTTLLAAASYANKYLSFDSNGNPQPAVLTPSGTLTQSIIAGLLTPQTPAEFNAGSAVVSAQYLPGNALRYGTNTTPGTTDMTVAIQAALNQAGQTGGVSAYVPSGLYLVSSSLTLSSNTVFYGDGSKTTLQFTNNSASNIVGSGVTDVIVRDMKITVTGNGNQSYVGVVNLNTACTNCKVDSLDISGNSGCGVLLQDAISCIVSNCYFHNFNVVNANTDVADIYLGIDTGTGNRYCTVYGNQCFGGAWHGIIMLTGVGAPSTTHNEFNLISNNRVGQHLAYGIADYSGNVNSDLYNQIIGNYVENIQGLSSILGGSAGAGIYLSATGGDVVANNIIRNCCVQTTNSTLAPGGIGLGSTNNTATMAPIVISGNLITDMTQYNGILVAASVNPVQVTGNTVRMPVSNTTGNAIAVTASSNCNVTGNSIYNLSGNGAILFGSTVGVTNNSFVANTINTANQGIQTNGAGPYNKTVITGNNIQGSAASACLNLNNLVQSTISSNTLSCGATSAVSLSACTQTRLAGNSVVCSSGQFALAITGTCTDSYIDESNYFNATGAGATGQAVISNGGTGFFVSQTGAATPGAGSHIIGDRVKNNGQSVTNVLDWLCTTAGTPGAWTSSALP